MAVHQLVVFSLGASLLWRAGQGALLRIKRHTTRRHICNFDIFRNGQTIDDSASDENVVFRSNSVLVVQQGQYRTMLFTRDSGTGIDGQDCHMQAEIDCGDLSAHRNITALLEETKDDKAGTACSSQQACNPKPSPDLGYVRSMIGGAIVTRAGKISRVASIGLGAGTIPLWWSRHLTSTIVEAIDISPDVIAAAPCFGLEKGPKLQLVREDGRKYIENQKNGSYDVIFVDAFDNRDAIPPCLKTVEFFRMVNEKLAPGGVLSMNVWPPELDVVYSAFATVFPGRTQKGQSPGLANIVLLGRAEGDAPVPLDKDQDDDSSPEATGLNSAWTWEAEADFKGHYNSGGEKAPQDNDICPGYADDH